MCQTFNCMPSQLRGEDPDELNAVKTFLLARKAKNPNPFGV